MVLASTALVRGGVWRHIADLACELRERGEVVSVALPERAAELRREARALGLPVSSLAVSVRTRRCVWHAHLHDTYDRVLWAASVARVAVGPTVVTEHLPHSDASDPGLMPGPRSRLAGPAKTLFKRTQFACTDAVIAVSASSAGFLCARYGPPRRLWVVPNGLRPGTPPSRRDDRGAGPMRVLVTGSVIAQKGHDVLVRAAARAEREWAAEILGDGHERARLEREAQALGVPVHFAGWSGDVAAALTAADVACMPSRWEAGPYAALEAMQAGLPVVATDVDGLRDVVQDGVSGLLVDPDDAVALARALDRLASEPALRARMGHAAQLRAAQFTSERMATQTVAVYQAVLARRSGG